MTRRQRDCLPWLRITRSTAKTNDAGAREARNRRTGNPDGVPVWVEGEGKREMGNWVARRGTKISETGGTRANRKRGNQILTVTAHPWTGEITQGGGGGFPEWNPYRGTHQSGWRSLVLRSGGGCRAITREADNSHVCFAFLVEKGNGGTDMGIKFVYIWEKSGYLW